MSLITERYAKMDNAIVQLDDWAKAQQLADQLRAKRIHRLLDRLARRFCPVIRGFGVGYHWSFMQAEYATDIVFRRQSDLADIYGNLSRTAIHTVKPDNVATFLGRKLTGNYQDEIGNNFHTRIEGTRIKHHMGPVSIKMYDKFGLILRIETTTNDLSFFRHYRTVEHRDGTRDLAWTSMKKGLYSLAPLQRVLAAANHRYLEFISALDDPSPGIRALRKISQTVLENQRWYGGFNLFADDDQHLFEIIARSEFNIRGFQNKNLRRHLGDKSSAQVCRILKRLRLHGLVKKVAGTYHYYLTILGRHVIVAGLRLKQLFLVPQLVLEHAR
jgi:hypothetical protein